MAAAALPDENSKWLNPSDARELYDLLKKFNPMIVVNELVKAVYKDEIRLRALYLGVKPGLPST